VPRVTARVGRTAESHLRNIFTKLAISSRREIESVLARRSPLTLGGFAD
jgi:DNA-binding NarL/FixJ family response regulator